MSSAAHIQSLIIDQLASREMGMLKLVVAVRRSFNGLQSPKGDLSAIVRSALRTLIASKTVVDHDGMFSLSPVK